MQTNTSRLDILLYAHDGRGLGHVSRSAAVGMALRRKFPELSVLLVTGSAAAQELIGASGLDWLKLPAYATEVVNGVSRGVAGPSGFGDRELGEYRARQLRQLVELYCPRLVLADHTPQGKHRELLPALAQSSQKCGGQTRWVLGVRGVVGGVAQAGSETARDTFQGYYQDLLWYGDSGVLGLEHLRRLEGFYRVMPYECGYVARLQEAMAKMAAEVAAGEASGPAVTVSVPWLGERSLRFVGQLAQALENLGRDYGIWHIFCDTRAGSFFKDIAHCRTFPFSGAGYVHSLAASRAAVIFGGYNSIVDVLSLGIPTLVVMREMADREQQIHLELLRKSVGETLTALDESRATTARLVDILKANLQLAKTKSGTVPEANGDGRARFCSAVNLAGAERAASRLNRLIRHQPHQ